MTNPREVGCFFFGCAMGVAGALVMARNPRERATKYLRQKAVVGVGYAKKRMKTTRLAIDDAAARAGGLIDRVGEGLDAAKKVINSVEKLRHA
jgi:hypothetical protein